MLKLAKKNAAVELIMVILISAHSKHKHDKERVDLSKVWPSLITHEYIFRIYVCHKIGD